MKSVGVRFSLVSIAILFVASDAPRQLQPSTEPGISMSVITAVSGASR